MKIKMTRPYGLHKAGEIVDVPERIAARLLAWEYAAVVRDEPIETASVEPVAEQAAITPRKVKRSS